MSKSKAPKVVKNPSDKHRKRMPLYIIIAILEIAAIILSLAFCMTQCNKPVQGELSPTPPYQNEDGGEIIIERPEGDGSISEGVYVATEYDEDPPVEDPPVEEVEEEDEWDVTKFETLTSVPGVQYKKVIQVVGTATSGNRRTITVDNTKSGILSTDFEGFGCNYFPSMGTHVAQLEHNESDAYLEINTKRFNDAGYRYARTMFQLDWMITNECKNPELYKDRKDWNKNVDYVNYINGVYDFNSDKFQAFVEACKMMEETGCEVYLAFGWKIDARVQDWFSVSPSKPGASAPRDNKAYAKAATALFKYMREEVGLTNFNIISFYNEPSMQQNYNDGGVDFYDIGDNRVTYLEMVKECSKALKKDDATKDVQIMAADTANDILTADSFDNHNVYLKNHASKYINAYTFHYYYPHWQYWAPTDGSYSPYEELHKVMVIMNKMFKDKKHKVFLTEFYAGSWEDSTWGDTRYQGWEGSETGYYLACANAGINGVFKWSVAAGYIDGIGLVGGSQRDSWATPTDAASIADVNESYYLEVMLNNYVPKHANVLDITWKGKDMHVGSYQSKDGKDIAVVVDTTDKATDSRNLTINFKKSLGGKTIYVYRHAMYNPISSNATIGTPVKTIKDVNSSLDFILDKNYGAYVFSTIPPVAQLELVTPGTKNASVYNECEADGSVKIQYVELNCQDVDIEWEVVRYTCAAELDANGVALDKVSKDVTAGRVGTIVPNKNSKTITYYPDSAAKSGDLIAIRGTIKGTNRFTSAIIEIK